jgi:predicted  nucleic acid-binding Zn-ribbon protein
MSLTGELREFFSEWRELEQVKDLLQTLNDNIVTLQGKVDKMAISQSQFDTDLASFLTQFTALITAVDALIASAPTPADLSAEDQQVLAAAQAAAAELNKLSPPTPVPTPAPAPSA